MSEHTYGTTGEKPVHKQWSITQKRAWKANHHGAFREIAKLAGVSETHVRRCFWTNNQKPGPTDLAIATYIEKKRKEQ